MKRTFAAGLVILLPLLVTFWIVRLIVLTLGRPFVHLMEGYLSKQHLLNHGFWIFERSQLILVVSYLLILIGLVLVITVVGFLVRLYVFNFLLEKIHWLFTKIPFINKIYHAINEVVETLFKDGKKNFGKAVLVPFPNDEMWCIGLITQDEVMEDEEARISVLLPNTPLPTIGFLIYYKKSQLRHVNLSVEEAFKAVISGGLLLPSSYVGPSTPTSSDL